MPPVELPPIGAVLIEIFQEMNAQRPRNGLDICPLDPVFFFCWQRNNKVVLNPFEQRALIALDLTFRKVMTDGT